MNPGLLHWERAVLTAGPLGKSPTAASCAPSYSLFQVYPNTSQHLSSMGCFPAGNSPCPPWPGFSSEWSFSGCLGHMSLYVALWDSTTSSSSMRLQVPWKQKCVCLVYHWHIVGALSLHNSILIRSMTGTGLLRTFFPRLLRWLPTLSADTDFPPPQATPEILCGSWTMAAGTLPS